MGQTLCGDGLRAGGAGARAATRFNLATEFPPLTAAGLLQPLLGIAVLALALKVPGLMGGGAAGGNVVSNLVGTAAAAAVGTGVGVGVRTALGVGASTRTGRRP